MAENPGDTPGKQKKKAKVRNVWISFAGRIVAQIIGAVASVVLGIMVLQRYQDRPTSPEPVPMPAASRISPARTSGNPVIAVLPLDNFSGHPEDAYFADGMTEALIADLAQIKGLRVISRTSTQQYKGSKKPLPVVAQELNADLIVEGAVTKIGDRVRITAQLIDARTDEHLWARSYDRTLKDLLELQGTLAAEIARSVKAAVTPAEVDRLAGRRAVDPAVYDLYLRGRHAWNLRTADGLTAAIRFFNDAVKRDPDFALAHVGLADAYSMQGSPSTGIADAKGRMSRAKAAATRALELDDKSAEAHTALGGVLFFGDRDTPAAERSFRRAIELNSNYPIAHEWLAILLAELGHDAEARRHIDIAVELDPVEATMHQARGLVHYYGRRYPDAVAAERRALELQPQLPFGRVVLVKAQILANDAAGAIRTCEQLNAVAGNSADLLVSCAIAYSRAGDQANAKAIVAQLSAVRPAAWPSIAQWYAATGDTARAFSLFEQLRKDGNLPPNLASDPLFEPLRGDPRFAAYSAPASR